MRVNVTRSTSFLMLMLTILFGFSNVVASNIHSRILDDCSNMGNINSRELSKSSKFNDTKCLKSSINHLTKGSNSIITMPDNWKAPTGNPLSGNYTIGGTSADFTTITAAYTSLITNGINGPVIFNINNGIYNEQLVFGEILGADSINTITFKSTINNADSVLITYAANTTSNWTLRLNGADNYIFKDLTFSGTNINYATVIELINGANHNTFEGNRIISTGTASVNRCIYDYTTLNNYNSYINNRIEGGYYGIYSFGVSSSSFEKGSIFKNNDISGFYLYGMYIQYQDSTIIENNYIHDGSGGTYYYGIYTGYLMNKFKIVNNKVILTSLSGSSYGIREYYSNYATYNPSPTGYGIIANNIIALNGGTGSNYGLYSSSSNGTKIYYNSVNIFGGGNASSAFYQSNATANTLGNIVVNNIFCNTVGGYSIYVVTPASMITMDYNDYYSTGGSNFIYWAASLPSLTALKSQGPSLNTNSINIDPGFITNIDLHVNSPELDSAGTSLSDVTVDFDYEVRNATNPDIGADEYIAILNDASVLSLIEPNPFAPGVASDIKLLIKNYGVLDLNSFKVNWSINDTIKPQFNYTGSAIPYNGTQLISLGNYTFIPGENYNLKFWTSNPNSTTDQNPTNDTLKKLNVKTALPGGTYTIGSDIGDTWSSFTLAKNELMAKGICGPIVINVKSGTYSESVSFGEISGCNSTNTITFKSYSNQASDVILEWAGTNTIPYTLQLNGADFMIFKNMTIKSTNISFCGTIDLINNANYNVFEGNRILSFNQTSFNAINDGTYYLNNYNKYNNNYVYGGNYGFYIYGIGNTIWQKGTVIQGNEVTGWNSGGIITYYQDSVEVIGNNIYGGTNSTQYGISVNYSINAYKILKNKVICSGSATNYGIRNYYNNNSSYITNPASLGIIANNFVSLTAGSTSNYGLYCYYSAGTRIYYNSVNIESGGGTSYAFYQSGSGSTSYLYKIRNNIFCNKATGTSYSAYFGTVASIDILDNNVYFSNSTTNFAYWVSAKTSFASFQSASSKDIYSYSFNPMFASATDLHVNNQNLNEVGFPIDSISTDIDGDTRSMTLPDIGADEFDMIFRDMAISEVTQPTIPCIGSSLPLTIKVKNNGHDTISTATIGYSINGIIQTSYSFSGLILSDSIQEITIGNMMFLLDSIYNIKIWVSNLNGSNDEKPSNDTISIKKYSTIPAGTYIIGPDTTDDFSNFNEAVSEINNRGICGSIIIKVKPGTYTENIRLNEIIGTSPTNTITFQSYNNDSTSVILQYTTVNAFDNYVVQLNGADNITFKNMTFKNNAAANSTYGHVFDIYNSANRNAVTGCIVNGVITTSSSANSFNSGANSDSFNVFTYNKVMGGYYGFNWQGTSTGYELGTIISNNEITGFSNYGIYAYYQDSAQINGNYIHDGIGSTQYGIYSYYVKNNFNICNNKIVLNASTTNYGIRDYYNNYNYTPVTAGLISNNMVSITAGSTNYGLYSYYSNGSRIYNNSINLTSGTATGSYALYQYNAALTTNTLGNIFVNNIFSNSAGGYAGYFSTTASVLTCDYNNYYTSGTNIGYWGAAMTTLSALQTASSKDIYSNDLNPKFKTAINLHKTPLSPDNLGTVLADVTTDFDGELRSSTTPDMGADEWSAPAHDMMTVSLLKPISKLCGTADDSIFAIVYNGGAGTETSVAVNCLVTTPTGNLNKTATITSTSPDQTDTLFLGTISTLTPGTYSFKTYTNLSTDSIPANDTILNSIMIDLPLTVPAMEDFNTNANNWTGGMSRDLSGNYNLTSDALGFNLKSGAPAFTESLIKKVGTIPADAYLVFDYRMVDATGLTAYTPGMDSIKVLISSDCGSNYSTAYVIDTFNHVPSVNFAHIQIPLASYVGNTIMVKLQGLWKSGDYLVHFDNIAIAPAYNFNLGNDTAVCIGNSVTFDAETSIVHSLTYDWNKVGGTSSLGTSNSIVANTSGNYYVNVLTSYGVKTTDSVNLTVNANPVVAFTGLAGQYCDNNSSATLVGSPANGTFTGTGISGTTFSPATAGAGTYTIHYAYTDGNGCSGSVDSITTVYAKPVVNIGNDTAVCADKSVTFNAGTFSAYAWNIGSATTQTLVVDAADITGSTGNVIVTVTDAHTCQNSDTAQITFNALPVVTGVDTAVKYTHQFTLTAPAGFASYLWSTGATTSSITINSNTLDTVAVNNYTLTVTNASGCEDTAVYKVTGLGDTYANNITSGYALSMYPNPTSGNVNFNIAGYQGNITMKVVDLSGKILFAEDLNINNSFSKDYNFESLAKGVYYVTLTSKSGIRTEKLIIQ